MCVFVVVGVSARLYKRGSATSVGRDDGAQRRGCFSAHSERRRRSGIFVSWDLPYVVFRPGWMIREKERFDAQHQFPHRGLGWATCFGYFIHCVTTDGSVGCHHRFELSPIACEQPLMEMCLV